MFSFLKAQQQPHIVASTFFYYKDTSNKILAYDAGKRRYAACPQVGPGNYIEIALKEIPHQKNRALVVEVVYGKIIVVHAQIKEENIEGHELAKKNLVYKGSTAYQIKRRSL